MNREEVNEYVEWFERNRPAMDHYVSGKEVQFRVYPEGEWKECFSPTLDRRLEYRPKPEKPRVGVFTQWSHQVEPEAVEIKAVELTAEVRQALKDEGIEI